MEARRAQAEGATQSCTAICRRAAAVANTSLGLPATSILDHGSNFCGIEAVRYSQ